LGFFFLGLAAAISGGGAAMLSEEPWVKWTLVILSVSAVVYESVALVLGRYARARDDQFARNAAWFLLCIAIGYTVGMQYNFLGAQLLKPRAEDQAAAGKVAAIKQHIESLKAQRAAHRAVPGNVESLSWLIDQLEQDKTRAGRAKLLQAKEDKSVAKAVADLDQQIAKANEDHIALLGRPPSDAKALLISLASAALGREMDPNLANLLWIALAVVFLNLSNIFMSRIRGLDYLQLRAAETSVKAETPPISDKGGTSSSGNSGPETAKPEAKPADVLPFPKREVAVKGNGMDPDVSATPVFPVVSHAGPSETAGTPLMLVENVSRPTARQLLIGSGRAPNSRETVFPKQPRRDKAKQRWETFEDRYRDLDDLIAETDRMPPIRELAKRWECRPETVILIRNKWSAENEGPDGKRSAHKPPVRREKGRKLVRDLYDMAGKYQPQIAAMKLENGHAQPS